MQKTYSFIFQGEGVNNVNCKLVNSVLIFSRLIKISHIIMYANINYKVYFSHTLFLNSIIQFTFSTLLVSFQMITLIKTECLYVATKFNDEARAKWVPPCCLK